MEERNKTKGLTPEEQENYEAYKQAEYEDSDEYFYKWHGK